MQKTIFIVLLLFTKATQAQTIDSIFVNLYTDSLKKGTYNYINIDGKLKNGRFIPLDSTFVTFTTNVGNFIGNNLIIDKTEKADKATITATLKKNSTITKTVTIYFKTLPDPTTLKTSQQILAEMQQPATKPKKKKRSWF
jgi:hypothetical protein